MSYLTAGRKNGALLNNVPPKVIRTEKENEAFTTFVRGSLIEDFEERRYQLPYSNPLDVLHFLMDEHDLMQRELGGVFGTPSIVSEVLSGTRELHKEHTKRLSEQIPRVSGSLLLEC